MARRRARPLRSVTSFARVRQAVRAFKARGLSVAFVPTMGALHAGHLSLIVRAAGSADRVVVSIFVNPLQFGPGEDFRKYPRDFARDRALLARVPADLLFLPRPDEFYPEGFDTRVSVGRIAEPLEGRARPGHFEGVATVVARLLLGVEPDILWLGQKDAQQVAVLGRMIEDLGFPMTLRVGPTVRERDGLALSSRNARLTPAERREAPFLHRALRAGAAELRKSARGVPAARRAMRAVLRKARLGRVDYAEVVDPRTFRPPGAAARTVLLLTAVRFPSARLIDNLPVRLPAAGPGRGRRRA
ncbi:MAG: pantoate--beta-alanine ligase [Candidatus Eiseniibacteriota bacterium]